MRKPVRPRPGSQDSPGDAHEELARPGRASAAGTAGTAGSGDSADSADDAGRSGRPPRRGRTGTALSAASSRSTASSASSAEPPSASTPELPPRRDPDALGPGHRSLSLFGRRPSRGEVGAREDRRGGTAVSPADRVVSTGLTDRLEERRRALRSLRLRRLGVGAGAVVLVAVLVWALLFSPLLALRTSDVTVKGSDGTVKPAQVRKVLEAEEGTSILRLRTGDLEQEVADSLVRVRSAQVSRDPLHGLTVTLTMRVAVATQQTDAGWKVMDGDGVVLDTDEEQPSGVVVVAAADGQDALSGTQVKAVAKAVGSLDRTTRGQVAQGTASSTGQVTLTLTSGAKVVWGDTSESALKARVLAVLLEQGAQTYDVSSPRTPTTS